MRLLTLALALALAASCSKENKDEPHAPAKPAPTAPTATAPPHGATPPHGSQPGPGMMTQGPAAAKDDQGRYVIGAIKLALPDDWASQSVKSKMRKAQFALPAAEGDTEPTELVVFHFGNSGAGSVQANLDRWYGQFSQPDGSDSKAKAKTASLEVAGMKVTTVDLSGHYVAAMAPGTPAKHDKPNHRMLAAIVEAPDGAYYFKIVGPEKSVAAQAEAFTAAVKSIEK